MRNEWKTLKIVARAKKWCRQEPKLLDVKNWKVIADICSQKHSIACEVDFFKHLRREFRVEQGEKGLLVNKQVVSETLAEWKFIRLNWSHIISQMLPNSSHFQNCVCS